MKALVNDSGKVLVVTDGKVATDECDGGCCGGCPPSDQPAHYDCSISTIITVIQGNGCDVVMISGSTTGSEAGDLVPTQDSPGWGDSGTFCSQFIPPSAVDASSTWHCSSGCDNLPDTDRSIRTLTTIELRKYTPGEWAILIHCDGPKSDCGSGGGEAVFDEEFAIGPSAIGSFSLSGSSSTISLAATVVIS